MSNDRDSHVGGQRQGHKGRRDLTLLLRLRRQDEDAAGGAFDRARTRVDEMRRNVSAVRDAIDAHNRQARTYYKAIEPHFPDNAPSPFRQVVSDSETIEAGQEIAAEKAAIQEKQAEQFRTQRKLSNIGRRFGRGFTNDAIPAERRLAAIEFAKEAAKNADTPTES